MKKKSQNPDVLWKIGKCHENIGKKLCYEQFLGFLNGISVGLTISMKYTYLQTKCSNTNLRVARILGEVQINHLLEMKLFRNEIAKYRECEISEHSDNHYVQFI